MSPAKLKLVRQRRARQQMRDRTVWVGFRARAQLRFDRAGHFAIGVRMSRATIGEAYNHARMREALVTCRFATPVIVPSDWLEQYAGHARIACMATDTVFEEIKAEARRYARKRPQVRHRVWKEK